MDLNRKVSRKRSHKVGRPKKNEVVPPPPVDPASNSEEESDQEEEMVQKEEEERFLGAGLSRGAPPEREDVEVADADSGPATAGDDDEAAMERLRRRVLDRLPESYRARFGEVGYAKYNRVFYPAMIIGPYDAPPVARARWLKSFDECEKRSAFDKLVFLVFWYGASPEHAFGYSLQEKFLPHAESQEDNPEKTFMKLGSGVDKTQAIAEMHADLELQQGDRKRKKIWFNDDCKALTQELETLECLRVPKKRKYTRTKPAGAAPVAKRGRPPKGTANKAGIEDGTKKTRKSKKPKLDAVANDEKETDEDHFDHGSATERVQEGNAQVPTIVDDMKDFCDADMSDVDDEKDGDYRLGDGEFDDDDNVYDLDQKKPSAKRGRKKLIANQKTPKARIDDEKDTDSGSGNAESDTDYEAYVKQVSSSKRGRKKTKSHEAAKGRISDLKDADSHSGDAESDADDDDYDEKVPSTIHGKKKGKAREQAAKEMINDEEDANSRNGDSKGDADDYDGKGPKNKRGRKKGKASQKATKVKPASQKEVEEKPLKKVRDVDPVKHETKAYKVCLKNFGTILESWEDAVQGNNFEIVMKCMDKVTSVAEDFTAPFIEHDIAPVLKKTKQAARGANHATLLEKAKILSGLMKPLYEEKKQHVPQDFKPPPRKRKSSAEPERAPLKEPPVRAQPSLSPQRHLAEKSTELTSMEGEPDLKAPIARKVGVKQEDSSEVAEKVEVTQPPNPPKPDRKSFSLGRLGQMMHREQASEAAKKPVQRSRSLPSWLVGPCAEVEAPPDDDRRLAVQFFRDMAGQFPSGKVDVESVAISLEAALFAWATQPRRAVAASGAAVQKADWINVYWDRVHAVVAGVCGKKDPGTLMHLILQGSYSTPMSVIDQKEEVYQKSFEGSPVL